MAYSSSPAASSFYSSMMQTECSLSLKSSVTPHRHHKVTGGSRFHHSKSHSISGSREATPVRVVGGAPSRRANSERFSDRQKTASLPLPKRRQLSLSANYSGDPAAAAAGDDEIEERGEHETVVVGPSSEPRRVRGNILSEDVYNLSNATGDNCSFVTITGNAFSNRRDSNCTLNSNSYKEQYILGDETLLEARESINKAIEEHTKSDGVISNRAAAVTTTTTIEGPAATATGKLTNSTTIGIGSTLPTHHHHHQNSVGGAATPGSLKKSRSRHYIVGTCSQSL